MSSPYNQCSTNPLPIYLLTLRTSEAGIPALRKLPCGVGSRYTGFAQTSCGVGSRYTGSTVCQRQTAATALDEMVATSGIMYTDEGKYEFDEDEMAALEGQR